MAVDGNERKWRIDEHVAAITVAGFDARERRFDDPVTAMVLVGVFVVTLVIVALAMHLDDAVR